MKSCTRKSLLALAVMAAAGAASAQNGSTTPFAGGSSVTMFGVIDNGIGRGVGSVSSKTSMVTNGLTTSRLGWRGTEDLGGGMFAAFHLEMAPATDSGVGSATNTNNQASGAGPALGGAQGLTFGARSTVSLGGKWGELRLGREHTPQYWNYSAFDPFNNNGVNAVLLTKLTIGGLTASRASNGFAYYLPGAKGKGFYGGATYYLGENSSGAANSKDGTGYGIRLGYGLGPVDVAAATGKTNYVAGDARQYSIGAAWDFGVVKVMGQVGRDKSGVDEGRGWLVGAKVPVGPGEFKVSYASYEIERAAGTNPSTTKLGVGYTHHLSKRTAIYTAYGRVRNKGGATHALLGAVTGPNQSSSGMELGLRHSF